MGVHEVHETLGGYDERQVWVDGCAECEHRGRNLPYSIGQLDLANLRRASVRAEMRGGFDVGPISRAEAPLLEFMDAVRYVASRL